MIKVSTVLNYLAPSLIAIGIVLIDIFISNRLNTSYFAHNSLCGPGPSSSTTLAIAAVGLAFSVYGIIRAFKHHHKWLGIVSAIMTLLVIIGGLAALFALGFAICFNGLVLAS
jgi:hypothetical protein